MKITVNILSALSMLAAATPGFGKPFARGLIDLPSAITAKAPIGTIDDHPWLNPNVSGVRIRTGWDNTETADGVYNWVQIDECFGSCRYERKIYRTRGRGRDRLVRRGSWAESLSPTARPSSMRRH